MKRNVIIAVLVALLALIMVVSPVMAQVAPNVNGMEIFAGIKVGQVRYGATFVAVVTPTQGLPGGGEIRASVNYTPNDPLVGDTPGTVAGINHITGGSWRLNVFHGLNYLGFISGKVNDGGTVDWTNAPKIALITTVLTVNDFSPNYKNFKNYKYNFIGYLSHQNYPPTVTGLLTKQ